MSIYANSSESYWKERTKKPDNSRFGIASVVLFLLVASAGSALYVIKSRSNPSNGAITQRRSLHEATQDQFKECETRVNSRQECTIICLPERNSIQRKTMHQACLHGCQQAHAASTTLGCRGRTDGAKKQAHLTEEDVFEVVGVLAYSHCSKFQSVDPKPDVFATCRKYHRAGTKQVRLTNAIL